MDRVVDTDIEDLESVISGQKDKLTALGIRTVNVVIPNEKADPYYYTFPQCEGFKENILRRNMRPTFHHLL